jgi:4-amino-4-deoxy-L-arabinose transferase-like glycosyltransferase
MNIKHFTLLAFAAIVVFRLVSIGMYPLMDTTEARYGEIARIMVDSNNWLTPQFDYNVPFWGKPPMHTWASALSIGLLDDSEFAIRLPHLITGLMTLLVVFLFAKRLGISALVTTFILFTSLGFYVASGMVMTDSLLTLSMTLAMVGFYLGWTGSKNWSYLGFVGIGIGLLTKGPIIIVLVGLSILPWLVLNFGLTQGFKALFNKIPVISGLLISLLIATPWYLMAELATPGFIDYFIIGEHWSRFVESGWEGDLYGTAHDKPRGIIWLYWLAVAFPWSFVLLYKCFKAKLNLKTLSPLNIGDKQLMSFLGFWLISPMILFTFAGNILPIYVLPGLPALALILSIWFKHYNKCIFFLGSLTPALLVIALIFAQEEIKNRSDKWLLSELDDSIPIYYLDKRSFSGRYYSQGAAMLFNANATESEYYLVVSLKKYRSSMRITEHCESIKSNKRKIVLLCKR